MLSVEFSQPAALSLYLLAALAGLALLFGSGVLQVRSGNSGSPSKTERAVFVFYGPTLVDANTAARQLLEVSPGSGDDWARLADALSDRYANLVERLAALEREPVVAIGEDNGPSSLIARRTGNRTRIVLLNAGQGRPPARVDHGLLMEPMELSVLRNASDAVPVAMWTEDALGKINWANKAYMDLAVALEKANLHAPWPLPTLFPVGGRADAEGGSAKRLDLPRPDGTTARFLVTAGANGNNGLIRFAQPIDELVRAEGLLSNFVQTMTKTFADLPAGLAVFNRERQLTLFNPALTDLLQLDPAYLVTRPNLEDFFDHLRESRKLPEPKNYRDWRERLVRLDEDAQQGRFRETWTLDSGYTYRVSGRPHADGALAFLVEDISSEVTLTRRFRQELDQGQAILDGLDQAIAVFSPAGVLTQANQAYEKLWNRDPSTSLNDLTVQDATRHWRALCHPSPIWGEIRDFVQSIDERASWQDRLRLLDGRELSVRCAPISGGATLVSFSETENFFSRTSSSSGNLVIGG